MSLLHYLMVYGFATIIGIQGAFFGIFPIGIVAWFFGIVPGGVMAAIAFIMTAQIFLSLGIMSSDPFEWTRASVGIGGYLLAAVIIGHISRMHHLLKATKKELQQEYDKTEKLMANILPGSISERLKKGEELIADRYEGSSILFCDIVEFTAFAKAHSPEKLV